MKYSLIGVALLGTSSAVALNDVKLPEYRSEFYGDTWRYTGHERLASEEDWVADAPQAYTVLQLQQQKNHHHQKKHGHKKHHEHNKQHHVSGLTQAQMEE